jgi:hypothetical protein
MGQMGGNLVLLTLLLQIGQAVPPPPSPDASRSTSASLRAERQTLLARESEALTALADAATDTRLALALRSVIQPDDPPDGPLHFIPLPEVFDPSSTPPPPIGAEAAAIRADTAARLLDLARRAADPGAEGFGLAAQCLREVLARDPAHPEARRLLGFVPHGPSGGFATPQAARNLDAGQVLHAKYGWVPADWLPHLDQGQLPAPRASATAPVAWLPAQEADSQRRDFARRPWKISTAHFDIQTNVPLDEAIAFGRHLEDLHQLFDTVLADLFDPALLPLARRFRNPALQPSLDAHHHLVCYIADHAEYVELARQQFRRDESISLGFYLDPREARRFRQDPRSYFYRDPGSSLSALATLFHEASHQILFEDGGPTQYDRNVGQYWVWEGLGTAVESFTPRPDGSYDFGDPSAARFQKAQADILDADQFVVLNEMLVMGPQRFKAEADVVTHYAQAMAWTMFFLLHNHGEYREPFLAYVRDAYRGRFRSGPGGTGAPRLLDRLGRPAPEIEADFLTYMRERPAGAQGVPPPR